MSYKPDPEFAVGDRIVVVNDNIDGSFAGEEGTIKEVEWNDGGIFAGPRWVYSFDLDFNEGMTDTLDSSDDFEIEPA